MNTKSIVIIIVIIVLGGLAFWATLRYSINEEINAAKNQNINSVSTNTQNANVGIANPASVYCIDQGGKLEIKTDEQGGQYGICVFTDGSQCEEWAFYRKECQKGTLPE